MKNWMYIIYIGLMGCLVSSCQTSEDEPKLPPGKVQITFTLALDDLNSRSRATDDWAENETTGVLGDNYENQIDLSTQNGLQVLVYSEDGNTLLGEVTNKDVIRQATENGRIYQFQGNLEVDAQYIPANGELACRLMVFANCPTIDTASLSTLSYAYNSTYIPMWGVLQCTLTLEKGEVSRVPDTIYLLRSMAKIEVRLADSIKDSYSLTDVAVDRYNTAGYVLPTGYASATQTESLMQQPVFNPLAGTSAGSLAFKATDGVYHIYLPEYENVGGEATPAVMTLKVDGQDYTLNFKDYASDTHFNIVRNHYYRYIITGIKQTEMEVLIEINPWNMKEWTYDVVDIKS